MHNSLRLAVAILCFISLTALAQGINAETVSDNVVVVSGGGGNITAVRTDAGVLVVDTFNSPAEAREARTLIEQAFPGSPIVYVINSHYHFDHVAGNQVFSDAVIIGHVNNRYRVRTAYGERPEHFESVRKELTRMELELAGMTDKSSEQAKKLEQEIGRYSDYLAKYEGFELTPAAIGVDGSSEIEFGGKLFFLDYRGNAHTDGDITVYCPEEKLLVMGDLLFHKVVPYIDVSADADVLNWIDILDYLSTQELEEVETVVSGHGEITDVEGLKLKSQYLKDLWSAVADAKEAGKTLEEAKAEIKLEQYKDYGRYEHLGSNIEACWTIMNR